MPETEVCTLFFYNGKLYTSDVGRFIFLKLKFVAKPIVISFHYVPKKGVDREPVDVFVSALCSFTSKIRHLESDFRIISGLFVALNEYL